MVRSSDEALWALDFPFGLPVEVMDQGARWPDQLEFIRAWGDDDYGVGLECLRRAKTIGGPMHIRRLTDIEAKAPFDPYHYRIIYQTFYGMRDVLGPLWGRRHTAILPFQYRRLASARRVLVEACPASTLKRMGLPHQNYKQPEGGPLTCKRRRTRRAILEGLTGHISISEAHRRVIMRNGGGDALDAVIAALGGVRAWARAIISIFPDIAGIRWKDTYMFEVIRAEKLVNTIDVYYEVIMVRVRANSCTPRQPHQDKTG